MIKLIETVDTNTGIGWWDRNREKLNNVINLFNNWQTKHRFDEFEKEVVKANIKLCRNYGDGHNFSDWQYEILDEMEDFIKEKEEF